jgi:hypothetical protein
MDDDLTYREDSYPPGCICAECRAPFADGDRYSQRLAAVTEGVTLVEIVCFRCALAPLQQ